MTKNGPSEPVTPMSPAPHRCPTCGRPATPKHRPFCSGRCADIDLGRWLKGSYAIPTEEGPEDGSEENER